MVVKMASITSFGISAKESMCILRSIRLVITCRPPPGGPMAATRVTSTMNLYLSVLRSYQPPWSTHWRISSTGGCAPYVSRAGMLKSSMKMTNCLPSIGPHIV